jgi:hypothetical protein
MSKTGDALEALYSAVKAKADEVSAVLPQPLQNEDLPSLLSKPAGAALKSYLNLWDATPQVLDVMVGADGIPNSYELSCAAEIEFAVMGGTRAERRAAFEAGLSAIDAAIAADRTLGGKVSRAGLDESPKRTGSGLVTDGVPNILAATIIVTMEYTSSTSF